MRRQGGDALAHSAEVCPGSIGKATSGIRAVGTGARRDTPTCCSKEEELFRIQVSLSRASRRSLSDVLRRGGAGAILPDTDSGAAIRGFRDPPGAQALRTLLDRHHFGRLMTNRTSGRSFVGRPLGRWLRGKRDEVGSGEEAAPAFIRGEQLELYPRYQANDMGFRGTTRAREFIEDGSRVTECLPLGGPRRC